MNLELQAQPTGEVYLNYLSNEGDRIFRLNADGTVYEVDYEGETPISTRVDLVAELRKMAMGGGG